MQTPSPGPNYSPILTESPLNMNPTPELLYDNISDDDPQEEAWMQKYINSPMNDYEKNFIITPVTTTSDQ
jgi:hypothetical protein